MKILENPTKETIKASIENKKTILVMTSIYGAENIAVYQVNITDDLFCSLLDYELNICSGEQRGFISRQFRKTQIDEKVEKIYFEVNFMKKNYNTDFVFLELEPEEFFKMKTLPEMSLECAISSLFEEDFFPKKYFELEIEKRKHLYKYFKRLEKK